MYSELQIYRLLMQVIILCLMLVACSEAGDRGQDTTDVSVLEYREQEAGTEPYTVRILVSPHFVRFDDGYDASDFALLDRQTQTIFSISHEESSILVVKHQPINATLPENIHLTETVNSEGTAPTIAGKQPVHVEYLANEELCYQAIIVPGLMKAAVAGLAEYAGVLGDRQLNHIQSVPEAMQTPCFLARYGYAPGRHYDNGLPVREWDDTGYSRMLTDFIERKSLPSVLFDLPDGYSTLRLGG